MGRLPRLNDILAKPVMVSSRSRFDSDVWYIDGWTPGRNWKLHAIHWDVAADQRLIDEMKYLAALLFLERDGRVLHKHTSAANFSVGVRHFLRYMERHGYSSLDQFDLDAVKRFKRDLHVALSDPEQVDPDENLLDHATAVTSATDEEVQVTDDPPVEADGHTELHRPMTKAGKKKRSAKPPKIIAKDEFTYSAAHLRLWILGKLWEHRDDLAAGGVDVLPEDPFPGSTVAREAEEASAIAVALIPPLPDEVSTLIMGDAFRLIGKPAEDVIELQRLHLGAMFRMDRPPWVHEIARIQKVTADFNFSLVEGKAWHAPLSLDTKLATGSEELRELIQLIRNACITVIFSGTGCRISEVLSLETGVKPKGPQTVDGSSPAHALPACISVKRSKSGLHHHFFMHGKLSKGEDEPKDEKWLCGSRPADAVDLEPPVVRAIRVLERLFEPWRELVEDDLTRRSLILTFATQGLPRRKDSIVPASSSQVNLALAQHAGRKEVGLAGLKSQVARNPKLAPYVKDNGRCIRTHQWRKTFALFMMRLDERMIPALAHHFKHMSIAVTEGAYMPEDPSMIAAAESVHMMETHRALYEMRRRDGGKFGKLDRAMDGFADDLERLIGDLPLEENYENVRHALVTRDLRIFNAEHGRCLIAANPDKARCHEAAGTSGWRRLSPNVETRTPGMCAGCENFSVSSEHGAFWRRRYVQHQSNWMLSDGSADFEVVRRMAQQAAGVLKALGASVPRVTKANAGALAKTTDAEVGGAMLSGLANTMGGNDAPSTADQR
ncbi:hypothetical protein [Sphingomonas corticis]|nr:hypothetical protein [Sphingomonas corticis]